MTYILFTVIKSYMNKLLYSGLVTQPRSISVSGTVITQNHVHYIGITFIHLTSPFFYHIFLETSLISFHVNIRLALNIEHMSWLISDSVTSTDQLPEPQGPAHQLIPPVISEALRQSAALILARISDVTHHPMSSLWQLVCYHIVQVT